jgi:transposase
LLTPANINDTSMMIETLERVRVPRLEASGEPAVGHPRSRPERVIADKGYPSRSNRAYLAGRGIKATIPDRADQHANRARKGSAGGRPPAFDAEIYKRRNVVERCIGHLKKWRGIAMRSDKTARNYHAGITLAAALLWLTLD